MGTLGLSSMTLAVDFLDEPASGSRIRSARAERLRVLLIEDNPGDAELVYERLLLEPHWDFELVSVPHLETGLARLRSEAFDAMIVDLSLPDATPAQTLAHIRETCDSVAVVVLSGSGDDFYRRGALSSGAQEFLVKGEPATLVLGRCVVAAVERQRGQTVQRQLERWISLTPDAVLIVDLKGRIEFVNRGAECLFGQSEAELVGQQLGLPLAENSTTEVEISCRGEQRYGELRVVPIDWYGRSAVLANIRDNTERRRAEAQLAATDRLVTVGTLSASIMHEINNPLAAMVVNLELAARAAVQSGSDELRQLIADTREAAERVRAIAGDLRMLSRAAGPSRTWVNLERVIDSTLRLAQHETRNRARVEVEFSPATPELQASESQIGQILLNLVVNAAQAIGDSGPEQALIRIGCGCGPGGELMLSVFDSGPGMPAEVQARLFSPFFTTKPASQGTGLGLSICKRIVESYGGSISVESAVGKGTTFTVLLPAAPSGPPKLPSSYPRATRRAKVLLVDDEVLIGQALARALREHDVTVSHSAERALELLDGSDFDLVLCDVAMPEMLGTELFELVEAERPELASRFVFLSGGAFSGQAQAILDRVPNLKLTKPLNIGMILSLIDRALQVTVSERM